MAEFGKYSSYYSKLKIKFEKIQIDNSYKTISKAFVHWYFKEYLQLDDQAIGEGIIDGGDDNGVDGIVYNEDAHELLLYQFKFPVEKNIGKQIDETTALKIQNGYKKLLSRRKPRKANMNFNAYREFVKENDIFSYKLVFVGFQEGLSEHAIDALTTFIGDENDSTGNSISYEVVDKKKICDIFDHLKQSLKKDIKIKYKKLENSYNLDSANSLVGFTSAKDIITACEPVMDIIFDENIRLFTGDNPVNAGIKATAISEDSKFFNFFHNGIVFICDECNNSTGNQTAKLTAASIVNGCQTVNILQQLHKDGELKEDLFLPIRIITTTDFDLRSKITEYLNTQTEIRESSFLANNSFIRDLQGEMLSKGYFLERLLKEYEYKRKHSSIPEFSKDRVLSLEKTIQVYAGYSKNSLAASAKRGKGVLFDKGNISTIIDGITADVVIEAMNIYKYISTVITAYRRGRRSGDYSQFISFLQTDIPDLDIEKTMLDYGFMNTADILLLNAVYNLKMKFPTDTEDTHVRRAIEICKTHILGIKGGYSAAMTKHSGVFEEIQNKIHQM